MTTTISQCSLCRHFRAGQDGIARCQAFEREMGIPAVILRNEHDHRTPYDGDNGVRFEPVDAEAARTVAELFGDAP